MGGGGGGANFGSERTFEIFCGKLLLSETSTRFSICERRSRVAGEILLGEQRRTDHRRVPKPIFFLISLEFSLVASTTRVSRKKSAS